MKQFSSLGGFAQHLLQVAIAQEIAIREGLSKAAKIVETEAKAEIGTYQAQAGPFIEWAELAESTKADRLRQGYTEDDPGLRSGQMRDSIGTTFSVDGLEAQIGSDDDKMVYFELGTSKQPPRSVLGGALVRKKNEVIAVIGTSSSAALIGDKLVNRALPIPLP